MPAADLPEAMTGGRMRVEPAADEALERRWIRPRRHSSYPVAGGDLIEDLALRRHEIGAKARRSPVDGDERRRHDGRLTHARGSGSMRGGPASWSKARPSFARQKMVARRTSAAERIVRIPGISQRLEPHRARAIINSCPTRPSSPSPKPPTRTRIASSAISEPSTPASAPNMPASAQVGMVPGSGGSGNRQR